MIQIRKFAESCKAVIKLSIYGFEKAYRENKSFEEIVGLTDELTGIANQKAYVVNIKNAKAGFCLLVLDVDNFKRINDNYGHGQGDRILKRIAEILRRTLPEKLIAHRLHGDEFALICRDMETAKRASRIIQSSVRETDQITVSQGIYRIEETDSAEEAFEKADQALYESKKLGRNQITIYNQPIMAVM